MPVKRMCTGLALAALVAGACAPALALPAAAAPGLTKAMERALLRSRELWATIDVCNPPSQRHTVGVRGSMPGDRQPRDGMYMNFHLQYMSKSGSWQDIAGGADSGWELVGDGAAPRQGGTSFDLKPVAAGKPAQTLRGVVEFQWRRAGKVLLSTSMPTSAGHRSLAGADPADYSAASCVIG
ncbi:MAG TPA: hypothetical protein VED41_02060 [Solirubrobacteraceae bacterium]|nr:hypothetical protein [Solirubrobacteraceae bacterium]